MEIPYSNKITPIQLEKVKQVAASIGVPASWLMLVMARETGGTFSPSIRNPQSTATGLIQFVEKTAKRLGTTTKKLSSMTFVQQMDYVQKYFKMVMADLGISKFKSFYDLYFAVFYPDAIGKPDTWVFPSSIYKPNAGIDTNKNGRITVAEFKKWALPKAKNTVKNISENKNIILPLLVLTVGIFILSR